MTIPDIAFTLRDHGLGLTAGGSTRLQAKVGVSSQGTTGQTLLTSDPQEVVDTFGYGPLVEAAVCALVAQGAGQVLCYKAPNSTAGTSGTVTHAGTAGGATMAVTGTPADSYNVQVLITQTALNKAAGTATFQYSLDGGQTWSQTYVLPTSGIFVIPNTGLTITFTDATGGATSYGAGDTYSFATTSAVYTVSDLQTACNALNSVSESFRFVHVVGAPADAASLTTLVTACEGIATSFFNSKRYCRFMVDAPDLSDSALEAALASVAAPHVLVAGSFADIVSGTSGVVFKRPATWLMAQRAGIVAEGRDLAAVLDGALAGVTKIYRDERVTAGYDDNRISSLRTFIRTPGFWIGNAKLLSTPGSDFKYWQHGVVIDAACEAAYSALVNYLSDDLNIGPDGKIVEADARVVEGSAETAIRNRLVAGVGGPQISDYSVVIDRSVDLIATETLSVRIRITPKGYIKEIAVDIGFENPNFDQSSSTSATVS